MNTLATAVGLSVKAVFAVLILALVVGTSYLVDLDPRLMLMVIFVIAACDRGAPLEMRVFTGAGAVLLITALA